jgi:hypothetical protein
MAAGRSAVRSEGQFVMANQDVSHAGRGSFLAHCCGSKRCAFQHPELVEQELNARAASPSSVTGSPHRSSSSRTTWRSLIAT